MQNYRKIFSEGLNADDDFSVIGKGQWVNASNIRTFTTDSGATGRIEAVGGTALIFDALPAGTNQCIGGCEDETGQRILWLNYNSNIDHGIYCFDKLTGTTYTVLMDADVVGGLNFHLDKYIHSCFVVNGALYWVNGETNHPRRVSIDAGIKAYSSGYSTDVTEYQLPVAQSVISWIRRPGGLPPTGTKAYQTSPAIEYNAIKDGAFQFCYRYNYRGYELSTLSPLSALCNYNSKTDLFNRIDVSIPFEESIAQDVLSIDLCVKFVEDSSYFIIKTWDRDITADEIEVTNHNFGTTKLTYAFYNDTAGEALDAVYKVKPFDSFPIYAYTAEAAKNRAFLGNYVTGYDTPKTTSLGITYTTVNEGTGSVSTVVGNWYLLHFKVHFSVGIVVDFDYYVIQTTTNFGLPLPYSPVYYWKIAASVGPSTFPSTLAYGDLTFVGTNTGDMSDWYRANVIHDTSGYASDQTLTDWSHHSVVSTPGTATSFLDKAFKSDSSYEVGITFYDEFQRKCGVRKKNGAVVIPSGKVTGNYVPFLNWSLTNASALTEIPDWAYYYSINITKCLSTRFFMDGAGLCSYASKNTTGAYVSETTYASDRAGLLIDVSSLETFKMGYVFNEGDIVKFVIGGVEYNQAIIAADGKYIVVQLADIGALSPTMVAYEIYTPYKKQINENFYEVGQIYKVTDPGEITRQYSIASGHISGDVYLFTRTYSTATFVAETMNINDKFWQKWFTDAGRPNNIDTIGQQHLTGGRCFSNTFLEGTKTNGLSSFEPLNADVLDSSNGPIRKLQLANKVQIDGTVLLSICAYETVSTYLGEQELFDTQGSAYVARASAILGTNKSLKGSFGTENPESVFEYNGLVYWWDVRNSSAIQYADNGMWPMNKKKFNRPANLFSKAWTAGQNIIGGFDPYHKEILFSIPQTEDTPPKGYLQDYSSPQIIYPYDIYDGQAKTLVYKHDADMWFGSMSFQAEKFIRLGSDLYGFKAGKLYQFNQPNICNFFDEQFTAKIMFAGNPGAIHTYLSMGIESNKKPSFVHFRTEDPYTQSSDLFASDFTSREGVQTAVILRDRLSPNVAGAYDIKQVIGDRLFGKALLTMLEYEFEEDESPLELRVINVGHNINKGTLINK